MTTRQPLRRAGRWITLGVLLSTLAGCVVVPWGHGHRHGHGHGHGHDRGHDRGHR